MKTPYRATFFAAAALLIQGFPVRAAAPPTPLGFITARDFYNLNTANGVAISGLTNNAKFPNAPDSIAYPPLFELHPNDDPSTAPGTNPLGLSDYGSQIIGYFYPSTTGPYTFFLCADDNAILYMSTDSDPAHKHLIAQETSWSSPRQYDASAGTSDLTAKKSSTFAGSQWPGGGAAINLTAGQAYYIEALFKEGGGGDNLSVSLDGVDPIPGAMLSSIDRTSTTAPFVSTLTGHGGGFYYQIQEVSGGSQVNFATVQSTLDGVSITPTVTRVGSAVVVAYLTPAPLVAGSVHSATVTFADNATPVLTQSSTNSFTVGAYSTIPAGFALASPATDPGLKGQIYQIDFDRAPGDPNSIANAEQQWARGFIDPNTSQPFPNVASQKGVTNIDFINWNGAVEPSWPGIDLAQEYGDFQSTNNPPMNILDVPIPGIPGTGSDPDPGVNNGLAVDNIVAEIEAYLRLKTGFYRMGVNSDDGFKVTVAPGAPNVFGMVLGSFNGTRGSSDTLFDFTVTADGDYPVRLLWWQGNGGANLEWFIQDLTTGNKYLINQNDAKAVKAFRTGTGRAYVKSVLPANGFTGVTTNANEKIQIILEDGSTSVVGGSIVLQVDGVTVAPTINKSGTTTTVTQSAPAGGYVNGTTHTGTLVWAESTSPQTFWTNSFSFTIVPFTPADLPANSFWIEAEDFDSTGTPVPDAVNTMPYDVGLSVPFDTLGATFNVDYNNNDNHENTNPTTYRSTGDPDTDGRSVDITTTAGRYALQRPGGVDITSDYRIGWVDDGEWYNYTRKIPAGLYTAYAAISHGDPVGTPNDLRGTLSVVTAGVGTTTQTLKTVGTFNAPSSGGWGDNDIVSMKVADGSEAVFKITGTAPTTLRFTTGSGDYDWFALVPVTGIPARLTASSPANGAQARRDATVTATLEDFSTAVNLSSVKLIFDGVDVTSSATITKPADITTVSYTPALMNIGSSHSFSVIFSDNGTPVKAQTNNANFTAHVYPTAGSFVIEAEDFNHDGGQHVAIADTMPYLGGSYSNLGAVYLVDYNSDQANNSTPYRPGLTNNLNHVANEDPQLDAGTLDVDRGTFQVTANFKMGWAADGTWYNYTRNIPSSSYQVWAALSHGDAAGTPHDIRASLDLVSGDITTTNQTTTSLGVFDAPATGGWGNNVLVPMQGPNTNGVTQVVSLGGLQTLRFHANSGDYDYFVLVPTTPSLQFTSVSVSGGTVTINWSGTGTLQQASALTGTQADWSDVSPQPGGNSYSPSAGTSANRFYRLKQ